MSARSHTRSARFFVLTAFLVACGGDDDTDTSDAGDVASPSDAGSSATDTGASGSSDGGSVSPDAGTVGNDAGGAQDASTGSDGSVGTDAATPAPSDFSFFVTSLAALRRLSQSETGFGGNLSYGETGDGAGLRGADKICTEIAEASMPGSGAKGWHAFLSTSSVNAKDRIGAGPWYDRRGRLVAQNLSALLKQRPQGADSAIIDDLPNETGTPNNDPDGMGAVDNHDTLTATNQSGTFDGGGTCGDWTSTSGSAPGIGHSWCPVSGMCGGGGNSGRNWIAAHTAHGCKPSVNLSFAGGGGQNNGGVGDGGGYGGFYCFALTR